jgi:hypothetical protein
MRHMYVHEGHVHDHDGAANASLAFTPVVDPPSLLLHKSMTPVVELGLEPDRCNFPSRFWEPSEPSDGCSLGRLLWPRGSR